MKKLIFILMLMILFMYIFLYKVFFIFGDEFIKYIINPVMWIILSIISYLLYKNNKTIFKYQRDIIYIVIGSSLLYAILFFTIGLFIGYTKNPYSFTISGIIINLFSIVLIVFIKEYIRYLLLIESKKYGFLYIILIFFIFVFSDINIISLIKSLADFSNSFNVIGELIIPVLSINLWMTYLCYKGGFISASIYRIIVLFPNLVIPIVPKYEWIIPTLFDILFPLFTYLIIEYTINKNNKRTPKEVIEESNPRNWIIIFTLSILIIMFSLGTFKIKPSVIITASMKPDINPGDIVIIEKVDINNIKVGDIIQYQIDDYSIVHRVVNVFNDGISISFITKGDNNKNIDRKPIKEDQVMGRVKYRIPLLGYPSYLIKKVINNKNIEVETGK